MDDLVKRLRLIGEGAYIGAVSDDRKAAKEAADRIEKLETALRDVLLWGDHCEACDYDDDYAKIEVRARKALEGKDD